MNASPRGRPESPIFHYTSCIMCIHDCLRFLTIHIPALFINLGIFVKCVYILAKTPKRSVGESGFTSGGSGLWCGVGQWSRPSGQLDTIYHFCRRRDSTSILFSHSVLSLINSQTRVVVSGSSYDGFTCYGVSVRCLLCTPWRLLLRGLGSRQSSSPLYHIKTRSIITI